jgi:hypothetical protein
MVCVYCGCALKGFTDAKLVWQRGDSVLACRDIDACNERARALRERAGRDEVFARPAAREERE